MSGGRSLKRTKSQLCCKMTSHTAGPCVLSESQSESESVESFTGNSGRRRQARRNTGRNTPGSLTVLMDLDYIFSFLLLQIQKTMQSSFRARRACASCASSTISFVTNFCYFSRAWKNCYSPWTVCANALLFFLQVGFRKKQWVCIVVKQAAYEMGKTRRSMPIFPTVQGKERKKAHCPTPRLIFFLQGLVQTPSEASRGQETHWRR
jgi:hypothetical protein